MALFKIPKREEVNIAKIVSKAKEEQERPPIKLKGASLSNTIAAITEKVNTNLGKEKDNYICITTDEEFIEYCNNCVKDGVVAIDTETTGLDSMLVKLVGVCIYSPSQKPAYVPVGHLSVITENLVPNQVSIEAVKNGLNLIKNHKTKFLFHNAYYDVIVIYNNLGIMLDVYWDTLIASHALNENESHSLKDLYVKYVLDGNEESHYFSDLFEGLPFCYVPYNVGGIYGAKDAKMTYDLYKFQLPYLTPGTEECEEYDLSRVANLYYNDLLPMIPILVDMKLTGMEFDFGKAKELKVKYTKLKEDAIKEFNSSLEPYKKAIQEYNSRHLLKPLDYPLNYNSPEQIRVLFYTIANIGVVYRKEPTGTGKNVLTTILKLDKFKDNPIREVARCLLEVKLYDKAISSFIDKLTEDATIHGGKIYSNLNLASTDTGRLSSSNPNQQQLPSKLKDIRQMFRAGDGRVFINCDFSKQEPCLLASTCKDPKLIEVFHSGLDVYSKIASMVFNNKYEDNLEHYPDGSTNKDGKERRSIAKKIVLSLMYSKGVKTLSEDLGYGTSDEGIQKAQAIYNAVMTAYPTMAKWMVETEKKAFKQGYVDNIFGRRRRLPELLLPKYNISFQGDISDTSKQYYKSLYLMKLNSARYRQDVDKIIEDASYKGVIIKNNEKLIADKKRNIINFCIQGGAAVVTLRALSNIYNNKRLRELGCKLVMTIHDESMCSVPKENAYECAKLIEQCSIDAGKGLPVPFSCDIEIAENWYGQSLTFNEKHELIPLEER